MNIADFFETTSRDLVYTLRTMRRSYGFVLVAVLVLALGIGANSACFTVIRAVLLKPLEYRQPDRLVSISGGATPVRFEEFQRGARSFSGLGAFTGEEDVTLSGGGEPETLKAAHVSAPFLEILGVMPVLGRAFLPEEDTPGGAATAMISAEFWRTHFGADLHIIGKTINLTGTPYTVVGVLPAAFHFPSPGLDVWLTRPQGSTAFDSRSRALSPFLSLFARLRPGVTLAQANAEVRVLQQQYARNYPAMLDAKPKSPVLVKPLKEEVVGNVRSELWMLFGAVGLVLLIACANLASLLLARAQARSQEFAVRAALGAGRGQLMRQLLTESVLLSAIGGTLGVLLALASLNGLRSMTGWSLPRADEIHLDGTVLAFAAVLSCATGILTGLMPAFAASRSDLMGVLRSSRTAGSGAWSSVRLGVRFSIRGVLVIGQIALSMVLLTGAALLIESVIHLGSENLGFDPGHLFTARVSLPLQQYDSDRKKADFFAELAKRVGSAPGVESAAAAMTLPMTIYAGSPVQDADRPVLRLNERLLATFFVVGESYFKTLKIALKRGRTFTERDREGTQRVTVIDEALARRFWPSYPKGEDPVGHHLLIGGTDPHPAEIIGIVGNVHQTVDNSAWPESMYVALAQRPLPSAMIAVRTAGDPLRIAATVRAQIRQLDRNQTVSDVDTMQGLVDEQLGERRVLMALLASFAAVATLLAAVGTYGVVAYSVSQRTRELGIRRALGAREADVVWLVFQQALTLAVIGTVAGAAAATVSTRLLKSFLFHVSATDPATIAAVSALFLLITIAASYLPVRRALDVDPMVALRYE